MAIMCPSEYRRDTKSKAERLYFDVLSRELSDEWIVLHSLGIAVHQSKPWAEIDFVLIGPPGVFCLEMKGGRIEFRNGRWYFTDADNNTDSKTEGPFEQVATASAALFKYITSNLKFVNNAAVGYGVVTPDIVWSIEGPGYIKDVVYDQRDKSKSFAHYQKRLSDYWINRIKHDLGKNPILLSEKQRKDILRELRGDFDLRPSLRTTVNQAYDELISLTKEQYSVLDALWDNERIIVRGGAGTGKTLLAVEEARRRSETGDSVLLCCFNKNLAAFIREKLSDYEGVKVSNLHGYMYDVIRSANLEDSLPDVRDDDLFSKFYPELCLNGLIKLDRIQEYDVLIVDEGQDLLRDTYVEVLDAIVKGGLKNGKWKLFLDPFQNIFGGIDPKIMEYFKDLYPATYSLSVNCRNTNPIAINTRLLSGARCEETLKTSGPEVEHFWYRDNNDQRRKISDCINRLLGQHLTYSEIVILSRYRLENSCLSEGLVNVPYKLVNVSDTFKGETKAIYYSTIGAFKGLEAKAVIVIDINDLESNEARLRAYVGCSRAVAYLSLFMNQDLKDDYEHLAFEYGRKVASIELPL